jgi:hypothetical protein
MCERFWVRFYERGVDLAETVAGVEQIWCGGRATHAATPKAKGLIRRVKTNMYSTILVDAAPILHSLEFLNLVGN